MKRLIMILPLLLFACCRNDALTQSTTNNPNFNVGLLFEHDDCKVYRFYDGEFHYFVKCPRDQKVIEAIRKPNGKTTRLDHYDVPTEVE